MTRLRRNHQLIVVNQDFSTCNSQTQDCLQCGRKFEDKGLFRPVKDCCLHVKCLTCIIEAKSDKCRQCLGLVLENNGNSVNATSRKENQTKNGSGGIREEINGGIHGNVLSPSVGDTPCNLTKMQFTSVAGKQTDKPSTSGFSKEKGNLISLPASRGLGENVDIFKRPLRKAPKPALRKSLGPRPAVNRPIVFSTMERKANQASKSPDLVKPSYLMNSEFTESGSSSGDAHINNHIPLPEVTDVSMVGVETDQEAAHSKSKIMKQTPSVDKAIKTPPNPTLSKVSGSFVCRRCGNAFSYNSWLQRHLKRHDIL